MKKYNAKARVKATGEILEEVNLYIYDSSLAREFDLGDLEIIGAIPDYWARLEHTYAGMAMQGLLSSGKLNIIMDNSDVLPEGIAIVSRDFAHALVEKLKNESK